MAIPNPFNSTDELLKACSFAHGDGKGINSIVAGTFPIGVLQEVLKVARAEIYEATGQLINTDFDDSRSAQLKRCESWLAIAELCSMFGSRQALNPRNATGSNVGDLTLNPENPSEIDKAKYWEDQYEKCRAKALQYLNSPATNFRTITARTRPSVRDCEDNLQSRTWSSGITIQE